jgi:acetyltransferase-like isoleucine patch superfamily enzyme
LTSNPLLIIGSVSANILERVETAILLGFEPIGVLLEGCVGHESIPSYKSEELPGSLREAPCITGAARNYPELRHLRIDQRWIKANQMLVQEALELGYANWFTLVHPSASVSPSASLGKGVFVGPLASVSSETQIGEFSTLGRNSTIGHHSSIGSFSLVGPGAVIPGNVEVGARTLIGPGAIFVNGLRISQGSLIGAGSVVTKHVRGGSQVMGNPAKKLRRPLAVLRRLFKRLVIRLLRATGTYSSVRDLYRRLR